MKIPQPLKAVHQRLEQGRDHWRWQDMLAVALLVILGANLLGFVAYPVLFWLAVHHLLPATLYVVGIGTACYVLYWLSGRRPPGQAPKQEEKD